MHRRQSCGFGVVTPQILKWRVWLQSGLLRSKLGEGREPRTPQFSNQIDATGIMIELYKIVIEDALAVYNRCFVSFTISTFISSVRPKALLSPLHAPTILIHNLL
jgi:hypothetical protein